MTFYHILKELKQLHFHDKKFQQLAVEHVLRKVSPPSHEFIKQVTEQLTISLPTEKSHLFQEIQQQEYCEPYVFKVELLTSYQPDIQITHSYTPLVVNHDHALSEFIAREDRCSNLLTRI